MRLLLLLVTFLVTLTLWGFKPLPPGAGASIKPNVLFVVDNSGSMSGTRIAQSKAALRLLLNDNNITNSIRLGLSQFPNQSWGCGSDRRQLLTPISDATTSHIARIRTKVDGLVASGATPLGNALRQSGYYFKGESDTYNLSYYPVSEAGSPVIHRCQRNYVIIFTDGGEYMNCGSWSDSARTEASTLFNHGLDTFNINGNTMEYPEIPVYAIGFHGVNVDYIAAAGGTGTGYKASDQDSLLQAFQQIVRDIGAKNITATSPTLIPGFTGPDADVIYMSKFIPRENKQWKGHLYRYHLGSGNNVLSSPEWDLHDTLITKTSDNRNIRTICRTNNRTVEDFTLLNADVLASCMAVNSNNGAGDPVEICEVTAGAWEDRVNNCQGWYTVSDSADKCNPKREYLEPVCLGNDALVNRIANDAALLNDVCVKDDLSIYGVNGTPATNICNGNSLHDAVIVRRYMCQKLETFCGCYESYSANDNKAKTCNNDFECGGAPNSCYNNSCVGAPINTNDPAVWKPQVSVNYENNIRGASIEFSSPNASDYNKVEITLENLKFNSASNSTSGLRDYLVIEEIAHNGDSNNSSNPSSERKYNILAKVSSSLTLFECSPGYTPPGIGGNVDVRGCNSQLIAGTSLNRIFDTHSVKLSFYSNGSRNAEALKALKAYRVKHTDVRNCHWESGGNGGITREEAEMKEVRRLVNFFRGKDSFQEDNVLSNPDVCAQETSGSCPDKHHMLSDIYNSTAKFIGTPNRRFTYAGYKLFKESNASNNDKLVLVGSNGGMVHAVRVNNGDEAWGFIPPNLLSSLKNVRLGVTCLDGNCTSPDYDKTASQFFVDSNVKIMDVCNGNNCETSATNWKTIIVVSFGEGGEGLMALDLADHLNPKFMWAILNETPHIYESPLYNNLDNCGAFKRVIYWEDNGKRTVYSNIPVDQAAGIETLVEHGPYDISNLSKTWSNPVLAQIGGTDDTVGSFVAILGAGGVENKKVVRDSNDPNVNRCINNENFGSSVYVLDVFTGVVLSEYKLPTDNSATAIPARVPGLISVLPAPNTTSVSGLKNRIVSQLYVGDLSGAVWRLDARTILPGDGYADCGNGNRYCKKLIDINSNATKEDYIYKGVSVVYDGNTRDDDTSLWVYFGTGDSSIYGMSKNSGHNHLVGLKDKGWNGIINQSTVSYGDLTDITNGAPTECDPLDVGWKYELPEGGKLVGVPLVYQKHVYFTVYFHGEDNDNSECSGHLGESYVYSFELFSGCNNKSLSSHPNDSNTTVSRRFLGTGVATAPVPRGKTMYFGISGDTNNCPVGEDCDFGKREGNIVKWNMPDVRNTDSNQYKSETAPFSFFRELY